MRILYIIPARAGSKGLPGKNTRILGTKPLVAYTIDFALNNMKVDDKLCISTNDDEVIKIASSLGVQIPFKRPEVLASDEASTYDVIMHAINYYEKENIFFDLVFLLQPTSPFRTQEDFNSLFKNYDNNIEMVVSVKKSKENPYFNLFEENEFGFLNKSKESDFQRRQDCPEVFAFNGSMYLMKVSALKMYPINKFKKIKKVIMPDERSIDIDTPNDWTVAEYLLSLKKM